MELDRYITIVTGDACEQLAALPAESVDCCVTSPPYWGQRDYEQPGQLGREDSPRAYVAALVAVFEEVRRVLRPAGTLWLNLGDSYANVGKWGGATGGKHARALHGDTGVGRVRRDYDGLKPKDLVGIPWRVALALQDAGWWLRQDIVWDKPNPMTESVEDRCTKAHEYVFLLAKSERYWFDHRAIREPAAYADEARWDNRQNGHGGGVSHAGQGSSTRKCSEDPEQRNKRSVWRVATRPFPGAHFATYPPELIRPCILAGCPEGGTVLDPFLGSGTTAEVARDLGRRCIGIELNPSYVKLAWRRLRQQVLL